MVALLAALAATVFVSGCASGREGDAGREGLPEDLAGLSYNVFITRELNIHDSEDMAYFHGPAPPPGYAYYGVFVSVCNSNRSGPSFQSASGFRIVDTQKDSFYPTPLPASNVFAYQPAVVQPRGCIPPPGGLAAEGPTGGAMLLFKLPIAATENRPMDLIVEAPPGAKGGKRNIAIELDI